MIEIYTDGSCKGWAKRPGQHVGKCFGGWAWVQKSESGPEAARNAFGAVDKTTNNRMELVAIMNALVTIGAGTGEEVVVYSDSSYAVRAFTEGWVEKWANNYYRIKDGPLKNKDLWIALIAITKQFKNLRFEHVKGHNGNEWNEKADELAQAAALALQLEKNPDLMEQRRRVWRTRQRKTYPLLRKGIRTRD